MVVEMMTGESPDAVDYDYHDLYIDENEIKGFFTPKDAEVEEEVVVLLYPCIGTISVKLNKTLKEFLIDKFIV